jgi:uncharacterized metal-binding protein
MIYGIPLFRNRVAPRCTIADSVLLIKTTMNRILNKRLLNIYVDSWSELLKLFNDNNVDILVCGGINNENRRLSNEKGISIIDNVACSENEIIEAIKNKTLKTGFGFSKNTELKSEFKKEDSVKKNKKILFNFDCLSCEEHQCSEGKKCALSSLINFEETSRENRQILNSALDISLEETRTLCRLSELVYFAIDMNYKKVGIAYCIDLSEPAEVVVQVLRRFFEVFPVCCKIGGKQLSENISHEKDKIACNPLGQAQILNMIGVDFNIIIGLCIGTDCIFTENCNAPVTTLFVKDKSLANNPIGAVYSDYYLKEATNTSVI